MLGQSISHYRIIEALGEGGMGVVYKAEDTKLKRLVALKFLRPDLTRDDKAKERFIQEAQAASALDHPNICVVHEIDETAEGQIFIVMAYYDGETLKKKVACGQLSVDSVIDIVTQVAQGLAKAHEHGITHRDIKPANVMITKDGVAKILDFGLAKLAGQTRITKSGTTLGTVAYMSPEQARGEEVDHRTDIWSLGVVLYEMLTGQLPFKGEYEAAMMYVIVNEAAEPLARHRPDLSKDFQLIVDKALEKEPEARYQHIDDLLVDLRGERKSTAAFVKPASRRKISKTKTSKTRPAILIFAAAAIVFAISSMLALYIFTRQPSKQVPATHKQATFVGNAALAAISPDGQLIAYVAQGKVIVQDLSGGQALEVLSGVKSVTALRWSPTGSELLLRGFKDDRLGVYLIPRLGGSHRLVPAHPFLCWSPDGSQIASTQPLPKEIWFTNTNKAAIETISVKLSGAFVFLWDIDWSTLGNRLLFLASDQKRYMIWTTKADGSHQQLVIEDSAIVFSPRWSSDGGAIYYLRPNGQTKDLMKVEIAAATGKAKAPPVRLQTGLQAGESFTLSKDNKRLLYNREFRFSNLWLVSLVGKNQAPTVKKQQLTTGTLFLQEPRISPDGQRIALSVGQLPQANIFVMPIAGGPMQQLTFLNSYNTNACWSPDGKEIAFGSTKGDTPRVWKIPSDGGTPHRFENSELSESFGVRLAWSPGANILYERPGNRNFYIINSRTEEERPLVANDSVGWMFCPRYSPNGKSVAVYWNRFDKVAKKSMAGLWLISLEDSSQVRLHEDFLIPIEWSADGKWIYAWDQSKRPIKILQIPASGGKPKTLATLSFDDIWADGISVTPDGKRIICAVVETQSDVWMMENFDSEMK